MVVLPMDVSFLNSCSRVKLVHFVCVGVCVYVFVCLFVYVSVFVSVSGFCSSCYQPNHWAHMLLCINIHICIKICIYTCVCMSHNSRSRPSTWSLVTHVPLPTMLDTMEKWLLNIHSIVDRFLRVRGLLSTNPEPVTSCQRGEEARIPRC